MHRTARLAFLALLVLAGCPQTSQGWPLDALCSEVAPRLCDFADACPGLEMGSGGDCVTENTAECEAQVLGPVAASVDAGRLAYDGAKAQRCFESVYEDSTCIGMILQDPMRTNADCGSMFTGQVPLGGDCYDLSLGSECAEGYCRFDGACPGSCAPYAALDAPCDPSTPCDPLTAYCDFEAGVCRPLGDVGATCGNDRSCRPGLTCAPSQTEPSCVEPQPEGAACIEDWDCATYVCSGGACRAYRAAGDPCSMDLECGPGQTCAPDPTTHEPTCAAPVAEGAPCLADRACAAGLFCDATTEACAPLPAAGASCDHACADGLWCAEGTCVALGAAGDACDPWEESCKAGLFCEDASSTCRALKADGEACTRWAECAHDCVEGVCASAGAGGSCQP